MNAYQQNYKYDSCFFYHGSLVTGPDGQTSGFSFTAVQIFPSITGMAGSGTFILWFQGTIAITVGGSAVTLTTHSTSGPWTLAFSNSFSDNGAVVITPTGTGQIADLRAFTAGITVNSRTYYFNDIDANSGKIMVPRNV